MYPPGDLRHTPQQDTSYSYTTGPLIRGNGPTRNLAYLLWNIRGNKKFGRCYTEVRVGHAVAQLRNLGPKKTMHESVSYQSTQVFPFLKQA